MKTFLLIFVSLGITASAYAENAKLVTFDLAASSVKWVGKKVTGSHNGELSLKNATGKINADNSIEGNFEIDMKSLKVSDIQTPKDNKKLVDHLASPDFFKVEEFPVVTFRITESRPIAGAAAGAPNTQITGELSVKGITHPITFPALIEVVDGKVKAVGTASVDRTKFDVRYGSGKFFQGLGDKLIYDDFSVEVDLQGSAV